MNYDAFGSWDVPFLITTFSYLVLAVWSIVRRPRDSVHGLYGILCLITAVWQGLWVILVGKISGALILDVVRVAYALLVFIPSIFYHFIGKLTKHQGTSYWNYIRYGLSAGLAVLALNTNLFITGLYSYSWGMSARAGILHPLFIGYVMFCGARMLILFRRVIGSTNVQNVEIYQRKLIRNATLVYCGGSLDMISNYGFPLFPLSFLFTGIALILIGLAIVRYEFLAKPDTQTSARDRVRQEAANLEMAKMDMTAAFPLVSQGELLGYLLLGEKMSDESYTKEDILLLRIVANQAALAYQRVRYLEMAVRGARTEMLGEIAGGFAHEIKTPLANISLPAELCYIDLTDVEEGKRKIEDVLPELKQRMKDIMQQTFKASDKIEAIRQFSKPGQVQMESVEISKILQNSISLLDHTIKKLGIHLNLNLTQLIPVIRGNAKQLEIVFVNLIKNASEAMASANNELELRNLWVASWEEGGNVVISVRDSGPGIKRTDIGHLFEAYFTTKGSSGTGMGLFLSHQVIKAHGGTIEVQSEEGKGTEFIVRLPKYSIENRAGVQAA
jgi:signal transduction histidine kinase